MENKELRSFVTAMIAEKKLQGVEQLVLDQLVDDMTVELENLINRALINELDDTQLVEFESLIDNGDSERLATFYADKKVDVQTVVSSTMIRFKTAYLGS